MKKLKKKDIEDALIKKAIGYDTEEVVEEYQEDDGDIKLTKRKVTKKNVPPDITAIKLILEDIKDVNVETLTDEELENEKQRLLTLLNSQCINK